MKRIIYIFIALMIIFSFVVPMVSFASETEEGGTTPPLDESVTEETTGEEIGDETPSAEETTPDEIVPEPPVEQTPEIPEEETEVNFFTRLYEAYLNNKGELFTLLGSGALFVLSMILKKDLGTVAKKIIEGLTKVLSKSDVSEEKQTAIIGGLNEMVDGYNEIREQTAEMKTEIVEVGSRIKKDMDNLCGQFKEEIGGFCDQIKGVVESNASLDSKVEKLFGIVISLMDKEIAQNAEVMEVLTSVYENNEALPQGVKNYVALKHAENAKLVAEASDIIHPTGGTVENE